MAYSPASFAAGNNSVLEKKGSLRQMEYPAILVFIISRLLTAHFKLGPTVHSVHLFAALRRHSHSGHSCPLNQFMSTLFAPSLSPSLLPSLFSSVRP